MEKNLIKLGCIISVIIFACANCSTIEFRSPIVIHPNKKAEEELSAPSTQAGIGIPEAALSGEVKTDIAAPANIRLLSSKDMSKGRFSSLGSIKVTSPDEKGFTQEGAIKELKIMAFKRYGSLAQGIAEIGFIEKAGLISSGQPLYREASAEVMTMSEAAQPGAPAVTTSAKSREAIPPLDKIAVVSSNDLFNLNFRVLGKVTIRDASPNGISESQVIKALKIEAYRLYGSRARGLTNIIMKKEYPIYFYKKPQFSPSPKAPEGYSNASAEVVYWP